MWNCITSRIDNPPIVYRTPPIVYRTKLLSHFFRDKTHLVLSHLTVPPWTVTSTTVLVWTSPAWFLLQFKEGMLQAVSTQSSFTSGTSLARRRNRPRSLCNGHLIPPPDYCRTRCPCKADFLDQTRQSTAPSSVANTFWKLYHARWNNLVNRGKICLLSNIKHSILLVVEQRTFCNVTTDLT